MSSNHVVLNLRIHVMHALFAHFLMEAETDYHTILGDVINKLENLETP